MHTLSTIETYMDETPQGVTIAAYDTLDAALAAYHYKMWVAMSSENIRKVVFVINNDDGGQVLSDRWTRVISPEPEPEPEPEVE